MKELRDAVNAADSDMRETIKWGSPTFEHHGIVAWMFAAKDWVHFSFPQGKLLDHQHGMFQEAENDQNSKAKRTIKLHQGDKVPHELITRLTRQAVAHNIAGEKVDFHPTKPGTKEYDTPPEYESFLRENGLLDEYNERPYFQRKGWIEWIEAAKRPETKEKRKSKMLEELKDGTYMPPKPRS